jgi:lipopolysaccharide transport system ATP-binding protein
MGRFLDTPVKRYSSGMYVRLAFAVAAHLDPEILIVDEVLAVGDASFQKKCLGKMGEVAGQGRTVLFVSHMMPAIRSLCDRAIELDGGRIRNEGEAGKVVSDYLGRQTEGAASVTWAEGEGPGDVDARLTGVYVLDAEGEPAAIITTDAPFSIRMDFDLARLDEAFCVGFDLATSDGTVVMRTYQTDQAQERWPTLQLGRNSLAVTIPPGLLNDGRYFVMPRLTLHCQRWIVNGDSVLSFEVHRDPGLSPYTTWGRPGTIAPMLDWQVV